MIARTTAIAFGPSRASATSGPEASEERLGAMGVVVPLGEVAIDLHELESGELEAALLVSGEDAPDQLALDAVGLDEDEGPFGAWHVYLGYGRGWTSRDCIG